MANGLPFNLEGLTVEQLRGARQFQQQLGGARAARVGGVTSAASPLPGVVNTTASSAARATAGPAGPSTPTATNPAPVATAASASRPSFGQRALRLLRGGGRALGAAGIGAVGTGVALDVAGTPTSEFEKQLSGLGVTPGARSESDVMQLFRDIGVRGLGALVNLGQAVNPFSGVGGARAAAPAPAVPAAAAAPERTPIDPEALIRGTGVPERGTGAFRVGTRPAVAVDTRGAPEPAAPVASPAAAPAPVAAPMLGTEGGVFGNLARFAAELGPQKLAAATSARDFRRQIATGTLGAAQQRAAVAAEDAVSNRIKAAAAVQAALGAGKKVTADIQGAPVITDVAAGTAIRPTVRQQLTEADVQGMMKKHKLSREQVLRDAVERGFAVPSGG